MSSGSWGAATGVGSLPHSDPAEAMRTVVGELPDFAHLPELPGRGPGADLIGRSAALLVDLSVDLTPAGWRLVPRPGIDQRRAQEFLERDLDALHDVASSWTGPLKLQAAGPWTLAAGLERTRGDRAVVDAGARRDLAQSLGEGLAAHVAAVAARVPGAELVVQLDEPSVPAVLQGGLPTVSGFGKLSAVEASVVEQELTGLIERLTVPVVVHCCASRAPLDLFRAAGAAGLSFDLGTVQDLDALHDVASSWTGPLKLQAAGPWTLAAGLERTRGDRAVVDAGARRDLAQSLGEGLAAHVAAVAARVPGAELVVQLDEPSVPAVLQGGLPTVSGFGKLSAVEASVVEQELTALIERLTVPVVVHCCASRAPLDLFRAAGAAALSFDLGTVQDLDAVGGAVEAGIHLLPGVVPGTDSTLPEPKATASRVRAWWNELGFPAEQLATSVTLTPSCGLAGSSPAYARSAMAHVREAAKYLQPE